MRLGNIFIIEDSITFKKTDKVGVFLRNEYNETTKSLKA
jgi:hypothetical protein